ncbi:MAG: ATP12 family chaperone protein [Acetobacteraceae bacterium]
MEGVHRLWREAAAVSVSGRFAVHLDARPIRLSSGATLLVSSRRLAEAIVEEWAALPPGTVIRREHIPLTRLAGTLQERIVPDPEPAISALSSFGTTELLCYPASGPEALVRREQALWQPWLDWAREALGAALRVTSGVMPIAQSEETLAALRRAVAQSDGPTLAALGVAVPALGSLILGLAMVRGEIDTTEAMRAAFVDERFQAECWGEDAEAAARRGEIAAEVATAERFARLAQA